MTRNDICKEMSAWPMGAVDAELERPQTRCLPSLRGTDIDGLSRDERPPLLRMLDHLSVGLCAEPDAITLSSDRGTARTDQKWNTRMVIERMEAICEPESKEFKWRRL